MGEDRMQRRFAALDETPVEPDAEFVARLRRTVHLEATTPARSSVDAIEEPNGETTTITLTTHEPGEDQGPKTPSALALVGATAAAVVLLVGLWVVFGADQEAVETGAGRGGTGAGPTVLPVDNLGNEAEADAFAVVDAAFAAHAAGNADAWFDVLSSGSAFRSEEVRRYEMEEVDARLAAGERFEVTGCSSQGFGDWPGIADSGGAATGYRFSCEATRTDLFHNRGGIKQPATFEWVVADGDVVAVRSRELIGDSRQFDFFFRSWLEEAHPDVFRDLTFIQDGTHFTADSTTVALEYVGEFVAQSDLYPLDASNP